MRHLERPAAVLASFLLLFQGAAFGDEPFSGTASCSASNCHGSAVARPGNILQNEYIIWSKHDHHSGAWLTLTEERGQAMGRHLGVKPETDPLCLRCHAPSPPPAGDSSGKHRVEDGVGCESCHGAASAWLKSHVEKDATHSRNVEQGMRDLASVSSRATLCVTCHVGNEDQPLLHRLYGAGHPRASFELDTFTTLLPAHWTVDADYIQRKGSYDSVDAWWRGQVALATAALQARLSPQHTHADGFPEFTLFSCYSCHRTLSLEEWRTATPRARPGSPAPNLAALVLTKEWLSLTQPTLAPIVEEKLATLQSAFLREAGQQAATDLVKLLSDLQRQAAHPLSPDQRRALLGRLLMVGTSEAYYELAEQIVMGAEAILSSLPEDRLLLKPDLAHLYELVDSPERYQAASFASACRATLNRIR